MRQALEQVASRPDIAIVRVKNRFASPTDGGWRDIMLNIVFVDTMEMHVCELQFVHAKLLSVRKQLGAHGESLRLSIDWHSYSNPQTSGEMRRDLM